jgi:hypothetical protein
MISGCPVGNDAVFRDGFNYAGAIGVDFDESGDAFLDFFAGFQERGQFFAGGLRGGLRNELRFGCFLDLWLVQGVGQLQPDRRRFSFFLNALEGFQRTVEAAFVGALVSDQDAEVHGGGHFVEVRHGDVKGYRLEAESAVFEPVGFRDFVDERGFDVVGRLVVGEEAVEEGFVIFGVFAGDNELAAGQAVFESVLAGSAFAFRSAGVPWDLSVLSVSAS